MSALLLHVHVIHRMKIYYKRNIRVQQILDRCRTCMDTYYY